MTVAAPGAAHVLGIHPNVFGFGYALFGNPFSPVAWSTHRYDGDKNAKALQKIVALLDHWSPATVVLEQFDGPRVRRAQRIKRLYRSIIAIAENRGIDVAIYSRGEVSSTFAYAGARTREQIAAAVAAHIDVFKLPRARRAWDAEARPMAVFASAALVLTHYRLDATCLLDQLG